VKNRKEHVESGLPFKACHRLSTMVQEGDQLEFQSKHAGTWTFQVGELPQSDARLLLVFEKRDADTKVPAFQSFAFPASTDSQLAIIDTYKGTSPKGKVHIQDIAKAGETARSEDLDYDRVYALDSGDYEVNMFAVAGNVTTSGKANTMHLAKGEDYVLLRTGGMGYDGEYDEELVSAVLVTDSSAAAVMLAFVFLGLF